MSIERKVSALFKGMEKNSDKKAFQGYFALLRYLIDPMFVTSNVKEIHLSTKLYEALLEYCNSYSNITFSVITKWCGIPIYSNSSFEDSRFELHYNDRIVMENINRMDI